VTAAVLQRAPDIIAQSRPKRRSLKRPAMFAAALIISGGAAYYGHKWWTVGRFFESTDDAYVGGDVTVLAPKVSGFINQVAVTDNQLVHAGDLLIRLEQSLIAQAQAGIAAADAETVRARDDQARFQTLARTAAASLQSFQAADADYKKALAGAEKARATLDAAQRQLDVIDTQKQQTQAALEAALADRDTAGLNLSYTELRAPFDGTIGNRSARTGAFAGVGSQLLAVVPARGLWIDANFKENQLAHMRPGEAVLIRADVLPDEVFHGHVASLAPATGAQFSVLPAENATGNFTKIVQRVPVRILLDGDASELGRLRPGLSVVADVDLRQESAVAEQHDNHSQRASR
jgi:membrane fusion protein, multidrug efflux system